MSILQNNALTNKNKILMLVELAPATLIEDDTVL